MDLLGGLRARVKAYDDAHNFTCDVCGREVFDGRRICGECNGTLAWNNGVICPMCGRPIKEEGICIDCKAFPLQLDKARSVFRHEGEAARLVVRFKRGEKYLYRTLAELSQDLVRKEFPDADALIGVPMTEKALKKRGYNQAELYAERLGELLGIVRLAPVAKVKETGMQKLLGVRERAKNLEGCFFVTDRKAVKGKRILLVDDTLTTGATLSELAGRLKRAGASKVYALTFTGVENKFPFGKPPAPRK